MQEKLEKMYSARKEKDIKLCFLSSGKPMVQQQFPEFFGVCAGLG